MPNDHKERSIQDYPRKGIILPDSKKYGTPPFSDEKSARAYITAVHKYKEDDIQRLLTWVMPVLYPCGCPNARQDELYGLGNRDQLLCDDGHYRCRTCGYERNADGSKYVHRRVSPEDKTEPVKPSVEQLSLLEWVQEKDEND